MSDVVAEPGRPLWRRLGDALASLAEAALGLFRDRTPPVESLAFTIGLIALGAKMAKADGVVTRDEVAAFRQIARVPEGQETHVARVFDLAKQSVLGFDAYARDLARLFRDDEEMLKDVLDGLFHIATADGVVHEAELGYLEEVARFFGIDEAVFARIAARHVRPDRRDPYVALGIGREASDAEIKRHWRGLVVKHHPDKLIARGVPPEFMRLSEERLAAINAAYAQIARERRL